MKKPDNLTSLRRERRDLREECKRLYDDNTRLYEERDRFAQQVDTLTHELKIMSLRHGEVRNEAIQKLKIVYGILRNDEIAKEQDEQ